MTLNGIKGLFAVLYQNYNIEEITIDYDYESILNQGIAFSLREKIYRWNARNYATSFIKYLGYKFLSLFVVNAQHFRFTSDTILLNEVLRRKKWVFLLTAGIFPLYYFLLIYLPLEVQGKIEVKF
jgi:hypothetical protein